MYHDVVEPAASQSSGSSIVGADSYKLDRADFEQHLAAIRRVLPSQAVTKADEFTDWSSRTPVFLTFDDGGISAYSCIADLLERQGWRGHFFITTDWLGKPGFVTPAQVRELASRGHVIGSHSCSHPIRMSACTRDQLAQEWDGSVSILADILGRPVTVASVPGGYYSPAVAETAAAAGIRVLFTSEPTGHVRMVSGCHVLGRYTLKRGMSADTAAGFASRRTTTCTRQALEWKLKRFLKQLSAPAYLRIRAILLGDR